MSTFEFVTYISVDYFSTILNLCNHNIPGYTNVFQPKCSNYTIQYSNTSSLIYTTLRRIYLERIVYYKEL
jgi:hypothetical protein